MIPQKLELTNFLSYRATAELDFQSIELACISGANGAGKSSILDAITWALFGRSRSRSDDDLINRLAAAAGEAVEVRFAFDLEGISYRILRRKSVGRPVLLELQIEDGADGWKTLSESKLRETQAQIEHLLRMNYDTFTNASFLLQGKADQFTTKTANQRKEILAELLGVTEWEKYREAAMERRKQEEGQLAFIEARMAEIQEELGEKEKREQALEQATAQKQTISGQLALQEKLLKQVRQTAAAVEHQKVLVKNLSSHVERIKRDLAAAQANLSKRKIEKEENDQTLADEKQIRDDHAAWQEAEKAVQAWQEKGNQTNSLQQKMRPFEIRIAETRSRLEQERQGLEAKAEQVEKAISALPTLKKQIESNAAELAATESKLEALVGLQESLQEAQAKLRHLEGERNLREQELGRLEKQETRIRQVRDEKTAVLKNKNEATEQGVTLESQLLSASRDQEQYLVSKAELDTLQAQQPPLRKEMNTLMERIERLETAELDSACPTCGQPLSADHRRTVLAELKQNGKQKGDQFRSNRERISELEKTVNSLHGSFKQKERLEKDQQSNQQRLAKAEARLGEIEQLESDWQSDGQLKLEALRVQLADHTAIEEQSAVVAEYQQRLEPKGALNIKQREVQQALSTNRAAEKQMEEEVEAWEISGRERLESVRMQLQEQQFALEARQALAELNERSKEVGYDPAAHQEAAAQRDALSEAPERYQALQQAESAKSLLESTIAELTTRTANQEEDLSSQSQQLAAAEKQLQSLVEGSSDLRETESAVTLLREEEIAAVRAVSVAQQRLDVLHELQKQAVELKSEKRACTLRVRRLKFLEKSCSRQGVQALLIEHALPEIEERANLLLERLTGGDMRVTFDTQRKLKTRDALAETLEIRIEDKDGLRPYDNYSGGEQFRINFAVRLALSQLLAHRSGARLQTLVIDEGFGSQDPQGRQKLVEAINAVRDEFACILVITHVAELRDAFSTRIEVQKTVAGSEIKVV